MEGFWHYLVVTPIRDYPWWGFLLYLLGMGILLFGTAGLVVLISPRKTSVKRSSKESHGL